jgi:hypothetical protein
MRIRQSHRAERNVTRKTTAVADRDKSDDDSDRPTITPFTRLQAPNPRAPGMLLQKHAPLYAKTTIFAHM